METRPCLAALPAVQMPSLREQGVGTAAQSGRFSLPPDTAAASVQAQTLPPPWPSANCNFTPYFCFFVFCHLLYPGLVNQAGSTQSYGKIVSILCLKLQQP